MADNAEPAEPVADGEDEAGDEDEVQVEVEPVATGPSRPALLRFTGMSAPAVTEDAYSLRLVSSRKLYDQGTFVQHAEHLAPLAATAELFVHPADLERLGLPAGGAVRLHAAATSLTTEARPDAGLPRGSVFLGFNLRGEQAADLIDATAPVTDVRIESPS